MRTLFLCLFLTLLPAIAFGQDCNPNSCPSITCSGSASPVCTESGYWVCSCAVSGDGTCYTASDCGSEGYSCVDSCCVYSAGCESGACLSASDCGSDVADWSCSGGCCESSGGNNGGNDGGCYGSCQVDSDCPGCQGCSNGTCYDDNTYCFSGYTCQVGECCNGDGCYLAFGSGCGGSGCGGAYSCGGCVEYGSACGEDCDCVSGFCQDGTCGDCGDGSGPQPVCDNGSPAHHSLLVVFHRAGSPLTSAREGALFDFLGNGSATQMAWTAAGADAGWLALDRNGNGRIDDGAELFSNVSPQPDPAPQPKLGFRALAVYDLPENGGNGDGVIDQRDAVFSKLLVWVDKNHNGVTDPGELLTMQQAGIQAISLSYEPSERAASNGNQFRLRSKITFAAGAPAGASYMYEVTLATKDSPPKQ